ncbi:hypothetical protein [Methylorubrum extorquens]|jgi:hypothetical protein|uniref:Uncharacterized protein n=1 Tax=Methylorubrum extorquens DSM 13060 TaxID=882800 RepID=H1KM90_METEX|nr:hypothetical protein [Methylorubrum extorquens]EHP91343.1 hypothetical protein MetexDRAFT_3753 [Methylorubrum extorquens DSM 13060]
MHIVELPEDQLDNIVRLANEKTDAMIAGGGDHLASVERTFREAELVWGVWQDGRAPHGVRTAILKGRGMLTLLAQGTRSRAVRVAGIRLADAAEGIVMSERFGDDRSKAA